MPDYFLIGPNLELRTVQDSFELRGSELQRYSLQLTRCGVPLGWAVARMSPQGVTVDIEASEPLSQDLLGEALRLFCRVVASLTGYTKPLLIPRPKNSPELVQMLAQDGFALRPEGDALLREPGPFLVPESEKADQNPEIYRNFYHVPWNFVPREWDVLDKVARDLGAGPAADPEDLAELRVLDLGCGCGKNATVLEAIGFKVFGLDASQPAIERCRQLVEAPDRFVVGSANLLPWPDRFFDAVLDIGCLHSVPDQIRSAAVSEIARVLNPRGVLYSRSFKPRPLDWVKAMPIKMDQFGIPLEEVLGLFGGKFMTSIWMKHEVFNYIQAMPRL